MRTPRPCPGDLLAGLVDGQLDHPARERVQRHLVDCADCRAERAAQADLKARLRNVAAPPVSDQLTARLLGLGAPAAVDHGPRTVRGTPRGPLVGVRPVGPRATSPRRFTGRQRVGLGGCVAALTFGVAFALGAPSGQPPVVRLDPGTDVFVADYAGVTADVPLIGRASTVGPPGR